MIEDQDEADALETELWQMSEDAIGVAVEDRDADWQERYLDIQQQLEDWYYEEGWDEDEIDDWLDWLQSPGSD